MDPHGADLVRLVQFSLNWFTKLLLQLARQSHGRHCIFQHLDGIIPSGDGMAQASSSHFHHTAINYNFAPSFIGSDAFCFKACDPRGPNAARFCEHIFDRIGCAYNAPSNAKPGVFESCEGDNQDFPGIYTEDGQVKTYTQPAESLGPISTMPYQPKVPASSNCRTFESSSIFASLATVTADPKATGGATSSSAAVTRSGLSTKASTTPSATGSSVPAKTSSSGANALAITGVSVLGVVFSALFFS